MREGEVGGGSRIGPVELFEDVEEFVVEFGFEDGTDSGFGELGGEVSEASFEGVEGFGDVGVGGDATVVVLDLRRRRRGGERGEGGRG